MDRLFQVGTQVRRRRPEIDVAKALLVALAVLPLAALGGRESGRALAVLSLTGDLLLVPACVGLAGFAAALRDGDGRANTRPRLFGAAATFAAALALAVVVALLAGRDWRSGIAQVGPVLRIIALPVVYGLTVPRIRRWGPVLTFILASALHVFSVVLGGAAAALLAPYLYFVAGLFLAQQVERLIRLADREPEFALAALPFVLALAFVFIGRAAPGATALRIADVGPAALALGVCAGAAAVTTAQALTHTRAADLLGRIGRAARWIAVGWPALFLGILALASSEASPPAGSLFLLAVATLGAVLLMVDLATSRPDPARARRMAGRVR